MTKTFDKLIIAACENLLHPSQNFSPEIFSKNAEEILDNNLHRNISEPRSADFPINQKEELL